jgi:hypothetical protein
MEVSLILVTTGRDPSLVELELRQMCETESPTVHFKAIESADGTCDNPKKAAMHSCIFRGSFLLSEPAYALLIARSSFMPVDSASV